jgi:hypothetical protein
MSLAEILEELPELTAEDRHLLFRRLAEMGGDRLEETPELLAALDEAETSDHQDDISVDGLRSKVKRWAHTESSFRRLPIGTLRKSSNTLPENRPHA